MLFPGSRIWYEGAVADLDALTEELKTSGLTGHLVLQFQDSLDIVVCVGGEFVKVFEKTGDGTPASRQYREIRDKCRMTAGRMTIFAISPHLAQRLRGVHGRRVLCSGTAAGGCDPRQILDKLRGSGFSGILDVESPAGKLLLDFETGAVVGCYAASSQGPPLEGLEAFRGWHEAFVRDEEPSTFSIAGRAAGGDGHFREELLMAGTDRVRLPLPSSTERLAQRYGRTAAAGELLFAAGSRPAAAFYVLSGEIELFPGDDGICAARRRLGPGQLVGISWLQDLAPARFGGRALVESRFLVFGRDELGTVFSTSPALASRCVRAAAALLARMRTRLEAFRAEPRLHDVETEVVAFLGRARSLSPEGVPVADLLRELAQVLPLPVPEIDALFRRLVALGSISQTGGKVALTLREL